MSKYLVLGTAGLMSLGGCQSFSKVSKTVFTPDHYEPLVAYASPTEEERTAWVSRELLSDEEFVALASDPTAQFSLIVEDDRKYSVTIEKTKIPILLVRHDNEYLNLEHENVLSFRTGGMGLRNDEFVQVSHAFISVSNKLCARRISDITQSRVAADNGFSMISTISGIAGAAFSSANSANTASAASVFFSSLTSNSSAIQSNINSLYSSNIVSGIYARREELLTDPQNGILTEIENLLTNATETDVAGQASVLRLLNEFNRSCTVGVGQRTIDQSVAQSLRGEQIEVFNPEDRNEPPDASEKAKTKTKRTV